MNNRIHGLDTARAFLMALGVFYHAGLIYSENANWRVNDDVTSDLISFLSSTIHEFRMETFYLISGFFFSLLAHKKKPDFLKERFTRVVVPLLFCGLTFNTIMNGYSADRVINWQITNYIFTGTWLGHLWFIGNLIIYFLFSYKFNNLIGGLFQFSSVKSVFLSLFFVSFFARFTYHIFPLSLDLNFIFISVKNLFIYLPYYALGSILYFNKTAFFTVFKKRYFVTGVILLLCLKVFKRELALNGVSYYITHEINLLTTPLMIYLVLSFFLLFFNRDSRIIRKLSDSSYTVYLLHQPLIVVTYYFIFKNIDLGVYAEYSLLVFFGLAIPFIFHVFVVNKLLTLKFLLNGVKLSSKRYHRKAGTLS